MDLRIEMDQILEYRRQQLDSQSNRSGADHTHSTEKEICF